MIERRSGAQGFRFEHLERRQLMAGSGLAGAYYARTNHTLAKFARVDQTIDFAWSNGTPASSLGTDGFSARWSGFVQAKFSEEHTFIVKSKGGVRVWVNGGLIIDAWDEHDLRDDSGKAKLVAGRKYDIRIDYWSDGDSPQIELDWTSARTARSPVPTSRLYPRALDSVAPTKPTRLRGTSVDASTVKLTWDPSTDASGVIGYDVYVGSTKVATTGPGVTTFTRTQLTPGTGYAFSIQALDARGNLSGKATTAITTTQPPKAPPSRPGNLHVTSLTHRSISLAWNASTDDGTVTGYRIYRNGVKIGSSTGTTFTDTGLTPGTQYTYTVRAADNDNTYSGNSSPVTTTTSQPAERNAFDPILGGDYDDADGVGRSGNDLINLDDGDWVRYDNVDFGGGAKSIFLDLALPASNRGGYIEIRLGSENGEQIGRLNVQPTGSWSTYRLQQVNIDEVSGNHDLFIVFKGRTGVANLRSVEFSSQRLPKIMALGDSITQQSSASPSYRYFLWHMLQDAGKEVDFVGGQTQPYNTSNPPNFDFDQDHEGHAGFRADEVASNVNAWASANVPDIVLLHIGTNDLRAGQSASSTINEIQQIITTLRNVNPNVKILLAQIVPKFGSEALIDGFNDMIPDLASSMNTGQSPITVVDHNSGFPSDGMTEDGVHPNATGDAFIAQRWYSALSALLQ